MQDPEEIKDIKRKFKKIIYVDIDSTICECPNDYNPDSIDYNPDTYTGPDYYKCVPYEKRIAKINSLYEEGHFILYWTARGTVTGIDWTELTTKQLKDWGCKYHKLILKKPCYDLFIDDKNINSDVFFFNVDNINKN